MGKLIIIEGGDGSGKATQTALSQMKPMLEASELVAQSTLSHVNAVKSTLQSNEEQMAAHADSQQALADRIKASLADADTALARLRSGADEFPLVKLARTAEPVDDVREAEIGDGNVLHQTPFFL